MSTGGAHALRMAMTRSGRTGSNLAVTSRIGHRVASGVGGARHYTQLWIESYPCNTTKQIYDVVRHACRASGHVDVEAQVRAQAQAQAQGQAQAQAHPHGEGTAYPTVVAEEVLPRKCQYEDDGADADCIPFLPVKKKDIRRSTSHRIASDAHAGHCLIFIGGSWE
jgi:hypothetical protein